MSSPQRTVIINAITINGPKGIGSFLVFNLVSKRKIETKAPIIKDSKILKNTSLVPKIKPKAAIRVISPSPMPPRESR